jgi:ATP-dependent Clp protease ATP-binding subunit ClpX
MSEADKNLHCSFCAKNAQEVKKLIAGPSVYICDECVSLCHSILTVDSNGQPTSQPNNAMVSDHNGLPSPTKIKSFLDQYIIGQDYAKMVISVAVHNHYLRLNHAQDNDLELDKSNILLFGPSGSGKTLIAQTIAKYLDVPFAIVDATSLTEAGYVGDDVESILTKLLQSAGGDVTKAERGIVYLDEIDKKHKKEGGGNKDVSGEGVQQSLLKIIEGTDVMVPASGNKKSPQAELVKINTKNILFMVGGAFVGLDKVVEKSMNKNKGIGFGSSLSAEKEINDVLRHALPEHLVQFGIIPELIGRLPITAPLEELTAKQLVRVLTEPKNAVIKQFVKMFKYSDIELEFTPEALDAIANVAKVRKTGARGLRSVIEAKLIKTQYMLQDLKEQGATKVVVTRETIVDDAEPTVIKGDQNNTQSKQ